MLSNCQRSTKHHHRQVAITTAFVDMTLQSGGLHSVTNIIQEPEALQATLQACLVTMCVMGYTHTPGTMRSQQSSYNRRNTPCWHTSLCRQQSISYQYLTYEYSGVNESLWLVHTTIAIVLSIHRHQQRTVAVRWHSSPTTTCASHAVVSRHELHR